jgi:hypothetical protein
MNILPETVNLEDYLQSSEIIDWHTPEVASQAQSLIAGLESDIDKAKRLYQWVRDEIAHSVDAGHQIVSPARPAKSSGIELDSALPRLTFWRRCCEAWEFQQVSATSFCDWMRVRHA